MSEKNYCQMDLEEVRKAAGEIASTSRSAEEVRDRMLEELGCSWQDIDTVDFVEPGFCNVEFRGPQGEFLRVDAGT